MNHQRSEFVRFQTRTPKRSSTMKSINGCFKSVRGSLKKVYGKTKTLENWRKTILFVCVVALAFDPLFFFIPVIDSHRFCFTLDKKLGVAVCVLRTFIDIVYVIHIVFHFVTELIVPGSQVSLRGETRKRRTLFYFIADIISVLPIPQVLFCVLILRKQWTGSLVTKEILKWVVVCQYIPRNIRIYPILKEVTRVSGTVAETKWIGAALNLFLYMLPSHVIGAFWYLCAIEKKHRCLSEACARTLGCKLTNLYCPRASEDNNRYLNTSCLVIDPDQITDSTVFNFGMYIDALKSGVMESRDFPRKFFYCFWWGLRNISAMGQNLETSNSVWEMIFAIIICISGVLLFAVLIGNVQKYLQSTTTKVDEMEEKRRDAERYMLHRMLPDDLRNRIRNYEHYKWQETKGVEEEAFLSRLPKDLRKDIKRHLCLPLLRRVPWFELMDDLLLDALCARLKMVLYTENSFIVREGDEVEDMLFILRGNLISTTSYGGKAGFFNSVSLNAGDFCGEELLTWELDPFASRLRISTRTVQARTEVEGFVLTGDDLKLVAPHYRRLHGKKLQHIFRFFSTQWRTWAACFIQTAWRRHCRRKLSKALRDEEEGRLHNTLQNDDSGDHILNLGAAIYASRFDSHALKNLRAKAAARNSRFPQVLSLLPEKPADPKFPINDSVKF